MTRINWDAYKMVQSMILDSGNKVTTVKNFLKSANDTNTQGNAIISYFTHVGEVCKSKDLTQGRIFDRFCRLPNLIEYEVEKNPEIKSEAKKFSDALKKNYPKTLDKRISLAYYGAVIDGKVKPKSIIKRFWVLVDQIIK